MNKFKHLSVNSITYAPFKTQKIKKLGRVILTFLNIPKLHAANNK